MSADSIIFFTFTLKKYFMLNNPFFNSKCYMNVLKTHFDCFNSRVNNLDDMEREQRFYRHSRRVKFMN